MSISSSFRTRSYPFFVIFKKYCFQELDSGTDIFHSILQLNLSSSPILSLQLIEDQYLVIGTPEECKIFDLTEAFSIIQERIKQNHVSLYTIDLKEKALIGFRGHSPKPYFNHLDFDSDVFAFLLTQIQDSHSLLLYWRRNDLPFRF